MKILIYSDLHLEFGVGFEPPNCDVDIAVLAGDIGKGVRATEWANQSFKCDVVQIAGNHEFYGGHIDRTWQKMNGAAAPHVHLLENQAFIWEGVRFLKIDGVRVIDSVMQLINDSDPIDPGSSAAH